MSRSCLGAYCDWRDSFVRISYNHCLVQQLSHALSPLKGINSSACAQSAVLVQDVTTPCL
eukprot:2645423-Amphidinium_carterae.1